MISNFNQHLGHHPEVQPLALRPRDAARMLGISTRTLFSWTKEGIVPFVRVNRSVLYPIAALEEWLVKQSQKTCQ